MKRIAILGSTGSIGTQALDVIEAHPQSFSVVALTARRNVRLLAEQARKFRPQRAVIADESLYTELKSTLAGTEVQAQAGEAALCEAVSAQDVDVALTATVGYSGLAPTLAALRAGKDIALANKETLVVAGQMVTDLAKEKGAHLYPVDSEHSAIFQCLVGEEGNPIEKLILTASGGPFRGKKREFLASATKEQALKHPNWDMGAKVTIDSASLMNKGLEVMEAKWLFGVPPERIEVVVHPQSIVHSLVQFEDGSIKAQLGLPDMKLPIQYALSYPKRLESGFERFNFADYPSLTFERPDTDTFVNLRLAFEALAKGGNAPCVLNAANEVAVERFLKDELTFLQIAELNEACLSRAAFVERPAYEDFVASDAETRALAAEWR